MPTAKTNCLPRNNSTPIWSTPTKRTQVSGFERTEHALWKISVAISPKKKSLFSHGRVSTNICLRAYESNARTIKSWLYSPEPREGVIVQTNFTQKETTQSYPRATTSRHALCVTRRMSCTGYVERTPYLSLRARVPSTEPELKVVSDINQEGQTFSKTLGLLPEGSCA